MSRKLSLYYIVAVGCTVVATVLGICAALFAFDAEVGYFVSGSPLVWIAGILAAFAVGLSLFVRFTLGKADSEFPAARVLPVFYALMAISFGAFCLLPFLHLSSGISSAWMTARELLCVVVFLSFALSVTGLSRLTTVADWLSLSLPVFWVVVLLAYYFDFRVAINGPVKVCLQFGALSCAIASLALARDRVGGTASHPAKNFASYLLGGFFSLAGSIPVLWLLSGSVFGGTATDTADYWFTAVLLCLFGLYLFVRAGATVLAARKSAPCAGGMV